MTKDECFFLGKVTKTHGLKGEVIVWFDVDDPEIYEGLESVFLLFNEELVPYFFESLQIRGKKSIAKFEDIETIEQTEFIINKEIYLPLNALPELTADQFYYHEIIGFSIQDENTKEEHGVVKAVFEGSGQDLIAFDVAGNEVLVPIADDIVKSVDRDRKIVFVTLPDGLISVFLD